MRSSPAYTLIEILVGISIIGLIFSFGYVSFREFSLRQALVGARRDVISDLRLAQQLGLSGQKPDDPKCNGTNTLNGYYFRTYSPSAYTTYYVIGANCTGGGEVITKFVNLPSGITLTYSPSMSVLFKVLGQGTNIPAASGSVVIKIKQTATLKEEQITIDRGGYIK